MRNLNLLVLLTIPLSACSGGGGGGFYFSYDLSGASSDLGAGSDFGVQHPGDLATTRPDLTVAANCADGTRNGQETDIDCGGTNCGPCADGRACKVNNDCANRQCTNGVCQTPASCNDNIKNAAETDIDCGGGNCPPCVNGRRCAANRDCSSNTCRNGTCLDQCQDGVQDGQETDIDCGGLSCVGCANGRGCAQDGDCDTGACTTGVCCGTGTANCDGIKANGCNVNLKTNAQHCGACGNVCPNGQTCTNGVCIKTQMALVGSFTIQSGPAWANMPPTYSCVEECAIKYGGAPADYGCSTTANVLNHMATVACYGVSGCQTKADTYKLGTKYIQGACSAFIADGVCASATNYCWR